MRLYRYLKEKVSLRFEHETFGFHDKQRDSAIIAIDSNTPVGYITYSVFDDEISISYIKVKEGYEKQGIGTSLVKELSNYEDVIYKSIKWGMMTPSGFKLKKKLDREYQFYIDRGYDIYGRSLKRFTK